MAQTRTQLHPLKSAFVKAGLLTLAVLALLLGVLVLGGIFSQPSRSTPSVLCA